MAINATDLVAGGWKGYVDEYLKQYFVLFPEVARGAGSHDYDSILLPPSEELRKRQVNFAKEALTSLEQYDKSRLSPSDLMDLEIIRADLKQTIFYLEKFRSWAWNPAEYNACAAFSEILANNKIPRKKKYLNLAIRLRKVPAYYGLATKTLVNPTREHTELAIAQNKGGAAVFASELRDSLRKSGLSPAIIKRALNDCQLANQALQGYIEHLSNRDDIGKTDFRIGKELYDQAFPLVIQTGVTAEEAYNAALKRKEYLHEQMYNFALKSAPEVLGPNAAEQYKDRLSLIKAVIDKISLQHCRADSFQEAIRNQIPKLAAFVRARNLLFLDPNKPLVVRKEPDYMAGVAGASISAPGPLEKGGNTYYNVGSLAAMSPHEQESFLREYNNYTLQILNIHEAIPGHYAQLVYANQAPSLIKSIFGNGAMIEGWAVYSELMMLENGYGKDDPRMWLMYYKWNLRTVCNTLLDIGVHTRDLREEEAMKLLTQEAFQTETEAKGKWRRATLTSIQLCSYFCGFDAILKVRTQLHGEKVTGQTVKEFNEKILSFGSAPLELTIPRMLGK